MKIKRRIYLFAAALMLAAVSAQSTTLWYEDFSSHLVGDADGRIFPAATPGLEVISTNAPGTWYRRINEQWAFLLSTTTATKTPCPADATGAAAMRAGYHGHTDTWTAYGDINTGIEFSANTNYTVTFRSKAVHRIDATTNLVGVGSVGVSLAYWDVTAPSNNLTWLSAGSNFTNLTSTGWVTNTMTFNGARMANKAYGQPLLLRVNKKGPQNTLDFESWVDWINVDGVDPYADWAAGEGLSGIRTKDKDGDHIDDFTEWATGGDPNDPGDTGLVGSSFMVNDNGTNRLVFITPRQVGDWPNGVDYWLEGSDNLIYGSWAASNVNSSVSGVLEQGFNTEFDAVTNLVGNVESNDMQFIRLRVGHKDYNP